MSSALGLYGIMVLILMLYNLIFGLINFDSPIFMRGPGEENNQPRLVSTRVLVGFMFGTIAIYAVQVVVSALFVRNYTFKVLS